MIRRFEGSRCTPRTVRQSKFVSASAAIELPPLKPSFVVSRIEAADWGVGRAGMRYRDLIPDRQGGVFIASPIHIADGGPVPD